MIICFCSFGLLNPIFTIPQVIKIYFTHQHLDCIIGANTLVIENQIIPDGSLVIGSPGKIKAQLPEEKIEEMKWYAQHYVEKIQRFNTGLKVFEPS